jgi:hypothetical protein
MFVFLLFATNLVDGDNNSRKQYGQFKHLIALPNYEDKRSYFGQGFSIFQGFAVQG